LCMYVCYVYFNKDQSINQYATGHGGSAGRARGVICRPMTLTVRTLPAQDH